LSAERSAVAVAPAPTLLRRPDAADLIAIPAAMIAYALLAAGACAAFGKPSLFNLQLYLIPFWSFYATAFGIVISIYYVIRGFRHAVGRGHDLDLLGIRLPARSGDFLARLATALPILLVMPFFMTSFTAFKNLANYELPFTWDDSLMRLDRWLHFGTLPWQWLDLEIWPATRVIEYIYASWGLVLVLVPFIVSLEPSGPRKTRFFVTYMLVLILLGNIGAAIFMSAGPFYFGLTPGIANPYQPLLAYLDHGDLGRMFSAPLFQEYLFKAYQKHKIEFGTGISAFPSIHVAMATLWVIQFWRSRGLLFGLAFLHLAVILFGSIHLAWHYAVDGYAGLLGAVAIYQAVGFLQRALARRRATGPAAADAPG
jgi:hypothetical protein